MENKVSEKSLLFIKKRQTKNFVINLLQETLDLINAIKINKFLHQFEDDEIIETKEIVKFITENIDLKIKTINMDLHQDIKLFLRIHSHNGTWYSDNYTPYCSQTEKNCSGPKMLIQCYGYSCPECKNEISFTHERLNDSPLNFKKTQTLHNFLVESKVKNRWLSFEEFINQKELNNLKSFRIDTRDFGIVDSSNFKDYDKLITEHHLFVISKYPNRFSYTLDEVKNCLINAKQNSGNNVEWRCLIYKDYHNVSEGWELKYINIIKISEDNYCILNTDNKFLRKEMWYSEIDKQLLGAH